MIITKQFDGTQCPIAYTSHTQIHTLRHVQLEKRNDKVCEFLKAYFYIGTAVFWGLWEFWALNSNITLSRQENIDTVM